MGNSRIPLEPDRYYHLFNHAVGDDNLFVNEGNFHYFLKKYNQYISPVADTFAYCLMPNHFHFAIRIKSYEKLIEWLLPDYSDEAVLEGVDPAGFENPPGLNIPKKLSQLFANFFNSYTKSFNKQQNRQGRLFQADFKRQLIDSDEYLKTLIHYIHFNPVHHGFVTDLRDWKYSSFESFFSEKATALQREEVVGWFADKEGLYLFHQKQVDDKIVLELADV